LKKGRVRTLDDRLRGQVDDSAYELRAATAWVVGIGAALIAAGGTVTPLPSGLGLAYVVLSLAHPIVVSAAMVRLATVAGAEDERRWWQVSLRALVVSTAVLATMLARFASGGSETAPMAPVAILLSVAALLHYLVSLYRTRTVLRTDDAGGRVLGATPDDVSRGATS
jgi:hypothetical protein